jgi:LysR family transcriptional regulator, glycine cleavage system transcriptional activator
MAAPQGSAIANRDVSYQEISQMRLPPLNALRVFEAAARLGSFSAAGEALHVSHAAISRQIRQLEIWFGRKLFVREARGVRLTKAGLDLVPSVSDGFGRIAAASDALRRDDRQRTIAVGCIPSIASRWLVPMLAEFSKAYRDISVQVFYAQAEQRLGDGEYDVLITLGEDSSGDVERRHLFSRASKPVCSPHYLARSGRLATPQAILMKADLLHDENRAFWADWFAAAGVKPKGELRGPVFQDFNLLSTAVIAGHGVALCPVDVMRQEIARGDLVVLSEQTILDDRSYAIFARKPLRRPVRQFRDWFVAAIDG